MFFGLISIDAPLGNPHGEWRLFANLGAFPVEDVDGDSDEEGEAAEDGGRPFEFVFMADARVDCGYELGRRFDERCGEMTGTYRVLSIKLPLLRAGLEPERCLRLLRPSMGRS